MPNYTKLHNYDQGQQTFFSCGLFLLSQVGELYCNAGYRLERHLQDCYEICYVVSGEAIFVFGEDSYPVEKNTLVFTRPGEHYLLKSGEDDPVRYFYVSFQFNDSYPLDSQYRLVREYFDETRVRISEDQFHMYSVYYRLFQEMKFDDELIEKMVEASLSHILFLTYRNFVKTRVEEYYPKSYRSTEDNIVYAVMHYIESNIGNIRNVSDIGRTLGYNYSYISHVFSKNTGKSIKEYNQQRVFEKAVELMRINMNVTQIAEKLGYSSINAFSRAFSQHYGIAPSKYLEQFNGTQNSRGKESEAMSIE